MSELPEIISLFAGAKSLANKGNPISGGGSSSVESSSTPNYDRINFPIDGKPLKAGAELITLIEPPPHSTIVLVGGFLNTSSGRNFAVVIYDTARKKAYPISNRTTSGKPFFGELFLTKGLAIGLDADAGAVGEIVGYLSYYEFY